MKVVSDASEKSAEKRFIYQCHGVPTLKHPREKRESVQQLLCQLDEKRTDLEACSWRKKGKDCSGPLSLTKQMMSD